MNTTVIIGGGVIGLSIAYEMSKRQLAFKGSKPDRIVVLELDRVGQKASQAGAGILIPFCAQTAIHPLEKLEAFSSELHASWAAELKNLTGVDNGYRECGGMYVARTAGEIAAMRGSMLHWRERRIDFEVVDADRLRQLGCEPNGLGNISADDHKIILVPSESQIRNPDHLHALDLACRKNGVEVIENCRSVDLISGDGYTESVRFNESEIAANRFCIAAGPWSEQILSNYKIALPMTPVRGQMVLFKLPRQRFTPIINEGSRYLVPRDDGFVLAGSTIEEVGFDLTTNPADIGDLKRWANSLIPELNDQTFVKAWAGLRPGTYDGFPYMGRIEANSNTFVATGHFKAGLHLSTGTAVVMADLMTGEKPAIDLAAFSPARVASC